MQLLLDRLVLYAVEHSKSPRLERAAVRKCSSCWESTSGPETSDWIKKIEKITRCRPTALLFFLAKRCSARRVSLFLLDHIHSQTSVNVLQYNGTATDHTYVYHRPILRQHSSALRRCSDLVANLFTLEELSVSMPITAASISLAIPRRCHCLCL